jgi:aminoglycoside phosphotransferase (APT) family kinase protein
LLAASRGEGPASRTAAALLRRLVDVQQDFLAAQDPDILKGSHVCYQGGRIDEERAAPQAIDADRQISPDSLTAYLQSRFPGSRAEDVTVIAGGFSKSTLLFTLVQARGEREDLVIRKDMPTCHNSSVTGEFPLLQQLHRSGFVVAEPRWIETDASVFGQPFMVSQRAGGSTDVSRWAGDSRQVDAFARQLANTMADLHALPLASLGYTEAVSQATAGEMMRAEIERWRRIMIETRREGHPVLDLALTWLQANIPSTLFSRPARLVHGDIGFHNLMVDGDRVTAVLDWEFAHPGDPVEDLVYTRPFIEKVMDWERFKSYYCHCGGSPSTVEEEFFYRLWSKVRNPVACVRVAEQFADAPQDNIQYAVAGYILGRYLELEAGREVVDALAMAR